MTENTPIQSEERAVREPHAMLQEERYLWMARAFVVMMVLALVCDFILLIALANVTPVLRVQPFYLEVQNKDQQIIAIKRPDAETLSSKDLGESLVRQYLLARFGIGSDLKELAERWGTSGPVFWMSSQSVYDDFVEKESKPGQTLAFEDNFVRNVQISSLGRTREGGVNGSDQWTAVLKFTDTDRTSSEPKEQELVATLETSFRPTRKDLTWADRLKNPLGFVVNRLSLKKKAK